MFDIQPHVYLGTNSLCKPMSPGTHPALLELLEVPQLMDACVRNGSYDDALDLRAFVRKLAVMHGDLGMAQRLLGEATAVADTMLRQLLARLRTNIQLPECLRVIGFLRRLEAFPEQVGSTLCLHLWQQLTPILGSDEGPLCLHWSFPAEAL